MKTPIEQYANKAYIKIPTDAKECADVLFRHGLRLEKAFDFRKGRQNFKLVPETFDILRHTSGFCGKVRDYKYFSNDSRYMEITVTNANPEKKAEFQSIFYDWEDVDVNDWIKQRKAERERILLKGDRITKIKF